MNWGNRIHTFQFQNHLALNHYIKSITTVQLYVLIYNRNRLLPFKGQTAQFQFMTQTFFVSRLQQPRPQMPMYLDCRADRLTCQIFFISHPESSPYLHASVVIPIRIPILNHLRASVVIPTRLLILKSSPCLRVSVVIPIRLLILNHLRASVVIHIRKSHPTLPPGVHTTDRKLPWLLKVESDV